MTENSDPLENPIAERINGVLKEEYLIGKEALTNYQMDKAVQLYNQQRPHLSCDMLTPEQAHLSKGNLKRRWKNYYRKTVNLEV